MMLGKLYTVKDVGGREMFRKMHEDMIKAILTVLPTYSDIMVLSSNCDLLVFLFDNKLLLEA